VRAGHRLEVTADGEERLHRYWSPPEEDEPGSWQEASAVDAVDQAVTAAVRSALVADVPVGAYLSGGVDSSLIVAKAAKLHSGPELHTFAAGFGDERQDELPWARLVSEHVGSTHHEVAVRATDFDQLWPKLTWHRDGPVSQPADIAVFRLAQVAREHVTVILSGEGGDELFAGYPKYEVARLADVLGRAPAGVRAAATQLVQAHLPARFARYRIALRVLSETTAAERNQSWFSPFTSRERAALLPDVAQHASPHVPGPTARDPIRAMLLDDLVSWLPDNLLERGDRMSMAASLELRPPLLDHRLVELAFRLPSTMKVRHGTTKWILKEVARRELPPQVVDRRKVGFQVPLDDWFRRGLRDSVRDRLTGGSSFVFNTLDRDAVRGLIERHESGRFDEQKRIFALMSLEVWHEQFFSSRVTGSDRSG